MLWERASLHPGLRAPHTQSCKLYVFGGSLAQKLCLVLDCLLQCAHPRRGCGSPLGAHLTSFVLSRVRSGLGSWPEVTVGSAGGLPHTQEGSLSRGGAGTFSFCFFFKASWVILMHTPGKGRIAVSRNSLIFNLDLHTVGGSKLRSPWSFTFLCLCQ